MMYIFLNKNKKQWYHFLYLYLQIDEEEYLKLVDR